MAFKKHGKIGRMPGPSRLITLYGESRTLQEWSEEYGVPHNTILKRVNKLGWDWERAIVLLPRKHGLKGRKLGPKLGRVKGYRPPKGKK